MPIFARFFPLLILWASLIAPVVTAQDDGLLQIDDSVHRFLIRQETAGLLTDAYLSHLPLSSYEARHYLELIAEQRHRLNRIDQALLDRYLLRTDLPLADRLNGFSPWLYQNGRDFISIEGADYAFQINPLLYLTYGLSFRDGFDTPYDQYAHWQNTRGIRASGHIGRYLFLETRLEENQRLPLRPDFHKFTAPRIGRTKYDVLGTAPPEEIKRTPYDYFVATGVLGFRSKYFEVRFGRDRNLWGEGRTSVQLSNYAPVYDQLQIRTTVWRFQYTNLFTAMTDLVSVEAPPFEEGRPEEQILPRRYGTFHRLSLSLPARIQFSVFEGIIFAPDSTDRRKNYDVSYLNPVIFYRAVETDRGSPDNAVFGAELSWIPLRGLKVYTQFILDEFRISELRNPGRGWWGNKWSWMNGLHLVDPIPPLNLSARLEYTLNRPYTYSHLVERNAYLHYNDLLGHPAGPNTKDLAMFLEIQPRPRVFGALNVALTQRGRNLVTPDSTLNYGSDPRLSYSTRLSDTLNFILQGVPQYSVLAELHAGYEVLPGLFIEAAFQAQYIDDKQWGRDWYAVPYLLLRWGLPFQSTRY